MASLHRAARIGQALSQSGLLRLSPGLCRNCRLKLSPFPPQHRSRSTKTQFNPRAFSRRDYFSANAVSILDGSSAPPSAQASHSIGPDHNVDRPPPFSTSTPPLVTPHTGEPPHRRRKRLKEEAAAAAAANAATKTSNTASSDPLEKPLPLDASAQLSAISSALPATSFRRLLTTCLSLSKPRLSFLIVLTTTTTYALYPVPLLLLPETTSTPSLSALTLVCLTAGTALTSASANALNMLMEPKYDAQMSRTRNRPLVRGLISKKGALIFAGLTGLIGVGSLWYGVNPTVAFLGSLNIFLYAGVYTPMKRISVLNTWVGAVVGAIPPLMGWAAAAGHNAHGDGDWRELLFSQESLGGWLVAALLFAWQFPHFNSLSWPIREEYKMAGYRMLAWTNSKLNGRVALRYSVLMFPICFGLYWLQITDTGFLVTSSVLNGWMVREAWRFWRKDGTGGSARALFWASVWHLPVVFMLMMVHKKGLWEGIWDRISGSRDEEVVFRPSADGGPPIAEIRSSARKEGQSIV